MDAHEIIAKMEDILKLLVESQGTQSNRRQLGEAIRFQKEIIRDSKVALICGYCNLNPRIDICNTCKTDPRWYEY